MIFCYVNIYQIIVYIIAKKQKVSLDISKKI